MAIGGISIAMIVFLKIICKIEIGVNISKNNINFHITSLILIQIRVVMSFMSSYSEIFPLPNPNIVFLYLVVIRSSKVNETFYKINQHKNMILVLVFRENRHLLEALNYFIVKKKFFVNGFRLEL